ncbi:MAG: PAS domain S-box protein [Bacteroidales bacterium]|jgi:PAS domain S-box-containing protein|nr:PAS domain S-box protein [Bacteroidales bacterium]
MNGNENDTFSKLILIIDQILSGKRKINPDISGIENCENEKLKELAEKIVFLTEQYRESYGFILDLAAGKLNIDPPHINAFANPFKQLHSDLRHLTWQIQEIANGDYDQCVSFSGDFSEAINKMIEALRERQVLADRNRENEYLFRSIFSTSPDGIIICDLDNHINNLSNAARKMLQFTEDGNDDKIRFVDLIIDEDKGKGHWFFEELHKGTPTVFAELRMLQKDGNWFWSEQHASVLFDSNGHPKGHIIIFRDITERKAGEEQLLKFASDLDESNRTKDKLFSVVAHDLKNPFNALLGFSDILLKEASGNQNIDKIKKYAQILNDSAKKEFDLLVNLLDWSRLQSDKIVVSPEPFDLNELIAYNIGIGNTTALTKNILLQFANPGNYPIITDKAIVNTILRNLIGNAVKYTPDNGTITISILPGDDTYQISVADSGTGITEENIKKLFTDTAHSTPGTNNEKGSGLGLVLCKEFVNKVSGDIWVKSVYGQGATFTFSLKNLK